MGYMTELVSVQNRLALARAQYAGYTYGVRVDSMPPVVQEELRDAEYACALVQDQINRTVKRLLEKLPRCVECQALATYSINNGPFLCKSHACEHPTAQNVAWHEEIRLLGVD